MTITTRFSKFFIGAAALVLSLSANAQSGLVTVESAHDVAGTVDRLVKVLESKGMNIFGRVNHSAGAMKAGMELPPTELVIFGNPKAGTPLMKCARSIAIDLPQKMLAWQADDGKVYLSYNDPAWLKQRHSVEGCDPNFGKITGALANFAKAATSK